MVTTTTQGAVAVLAVDAPLNAESSDALRSAVEALPRIGRPQLVIDLSGVPLIDSAGCEALLDVRDSVCDIGGACCLAGVAPLCRDILWAAGLDEGFDVFQGTKEAVASYAR
ncbi:STAS domain-containing protein [Botrimarina hoheduenensis]|uniref:STAS domain protein n=1 Tax=Botrimarina hoheduenensis TaxID=2528000 RepID=A0A5C5VQC8_9BACT|nr:STAS domain-containing protein [Botrimarina hoheduenensis]TWT40145.1 STAS domain protein [Botrimarina hoheduenensis]